MKIKRVKVNNGAGGAKQVQAQNTVKDEAVLECAELHNGVCNAHTVHNHGIGAGFHNPFRAADSDHAAQTRVRVRQNPDD